METVLIYFNLILILIYLTFSIFVLDVVCKNHCYLIYFGICFNFYNFWAFEVN